MKRKDTQERASRIIDEYRKGTEIRLIMAFFGITKGGLYHILKKNDIPKREKHLTRKKWYAILRTDE